jgi:hypothetical protein
MSHLPAPAAHIHIHTQIPIDCHMAHGHMGTWRHLGTWAHGSGRQRACQNQSQRPAAVRQGRIPTGLQFNFKIPRAQTKGLPSKTRSTQVCTRSVFSIDSHRSQHRSSTTAVGSPAAGRQKPHVNYLAGQQQHEWRCRLAFEAPLPRGVATQTPRPDGQIGLGPNANWPGAPHEAIAPVAQT